MALNVRDVMTAEVSTTSPDALLVTAAREIIEKRYSGIPVTEGAELVGLVEVEDLLPRPSQVPFTRVPVLEFQGGWVEEDDLSAFYEALQELTVGEVMRVELPTISADAPLGKALIQLIQNDYRRLLAVDDDDRLVGVLTRTDLLRVLLEAA